MTRRLRTVGTVLAMATTGAGVSAVPAWALSDSDCGDAPAGGSIESLGSVCELRFSEAGDYSWTIPDGASDIYAMLIGGGGGAYVSSGFSDNGYAGAGGDVIFVDLTSAAVGSVVDVTVGAGGASNGSTPTAGGDSVVSVDGTNHTADGGAPGAIDPSGWLFGFCSPGFDGYFGEAPGAGTPGTTPYGDACSGGQPGIQPSTDPSAPAVFQDDNTEYGHGGGVFSSGGSVSYTAGSGASITGNPGLSYSDGLRGLVSLRYSMATDESSGSSSVDELAATGNAVPVGALAGGSLLALLAGIGVLIARGYRRSN